MLTEGEPFINFKIIFQPIIVRLFLMTCSRGSYNDEPALPIDEPKKNSTIGLICAILLGYASLYVLLYTDECIEP